MNTNISDTNSQLFCDCTNFILSCAKTLRDFGPKGSRLSFKYTVCPQCSSTVVHIILNKSFISQRKIVGHLDQKSFIELKTKIAFHLSNITDQSLHSIRSD